MPGFAQLLLATLVVTVPAPRPEGNQSFSGDYSVRFLGVPVAYSRFNSTFEKTSFSVKGQVSMAGLAQLFADMQGSVSTAGRFAGGRTQPAAFRIDYKEGGKAKMTSIRFSGGAVTKTENVPPLRKRGADWVPVQDRHLRAVADPLSATLIRADSLEKVCGRSVRIYDGEMLADLKLTFDSTGTISAGGYQGAIVTCNIGFEPVAGYRKGRKALDYLKSRSRIKVAFAPLGNTGVYAPIRASVGTQIGTVTIVAERFEATK